MRHIGVISVLTVFLGGWRASNAIDCSVDSLSICLRYFISNRFDLLHLDDDLPAWNDNSTRLALRCRAYNKFSGCIGQVIPSCNTSFQVSLKGLDAAYSFLCSDDGFREYQYYQKCFRKPQLSEAAKLCNQTFYSKLSVVNQDGVPAPQYCRYLDDYIECLTTVVSINCGQNASRWEDTWIRNLKKYDKALNKCDDWANEVPGEGRDVWATALLVALAMTTALMAAGVLSLVVCIIKRRLAYARAQRADNPDTNQAPLPPPYSVVHQTPGPDGQLRAHLVDSQSAAAAAASVTGEDASSVSSFASSLPHKAPILPPPYCEPFGSAPAYEEICANESPPYQEERINEGYQRDEGEDVEKRPNIDIEAPRV